jgi:hypothetical protein
VARRLMQAFVAFAGWLSACAERERAAPSAGRTGR